MAEPPTDQPNAAATIEEVQEQARQQQMESFLSVPVENSVRQIFNRFVKWVDSDAAPDCHPTADGKYLTRWNVDQYFLREIPKRPGQEKYIRKNVSSLQWYVGYREQAGFLPGEQLVIESDSVKTGLRLQSINQKKRQEGVNRGADPHYGLQDSISNPDRRRIMEFIYSDRKDWAPASFTYSWGLNAAVRGASNRSLVMADLNMSYAFGPEPEGPTARSLLLVLRRGDLHKDRHDTDKQVCCWRHKEPVLCSVGATSRLVIWKLRQLGDTINFFHEDKTERANWWDIPLIDWSKYEEAATATKDILRNTGVYSSKITHHRTAALQYAGFFGLAPWQVNTMTNHMIDKQHSAYQSITEYKTCSTMAGFHSGVPYWVGRAMLPLQHSVGYYESKLLPHLDTWRQQASSAQGDKSMLCDKVLNHIVPYLVTVMVQDGIYFAQQFPDNEASKLLINQIPGYLNWARQSREWVANSTATRVMDQVEALDAASLAAFTSLHNKIDGLSQQLSSVQRALVKISTAIENRPTIAVEPSSVPPLGQQQQSQEQQQSVAVLGVAVADTTIGVGSNNGELDNIDDEMRTVNDVLGQADNGRRPSFPRVFPKKAVILLSQWKNNNLGEFRAVKRTNWVRSLAMSYKKRLDCVQYIQARAQNDLSSDEEAAATIDRENQQTLDQWLSYQKATDPKVAPRAKRTNDVGLGTRRRNATLTTPARTNTTNTTNTTARARANTTPAVATTPVATTAQRRFGMPPGGRGRGPGRGGRGRNNNTGGRGRGGRGYRRRAPSTQQVGDRNWLQNLTPYQRRRRAQDAAIMAGDGGHGGWLNERGITSGRRDRQMEEIDEALI